MLYLIYFIALLVLIRHINMHIKRKDILHVLTVCGVSTCIHYRMYENILISINSIEIEQIKYIKIIIEIMNFYDLFAIFLAIPNF